MTLWRLLDTGVSDAFRNMALDEAIAQTVRDGGLPPTLRFYGWRRPSVSLGCFQRAGDIDISYCKEAAIPVVRRPSGGRGILHGDELTYSFSACLSDFPGDLLESYGNLAKAFSRAFAALGVPNEATIERRRAGQSPVCFQSPSYGELTSGGRKIIGSAQKRWRNGLLQQGSIPVMPDYAQMERVFRTKAEGGMAGLSEIIAGLGAEALKGALRDAFEETFGVRLVEEAPGPLEEGLAEELLRLKYLRPEWNLRR